MWNVCYCLYESDCCHLMKKVDLNTNRTEAKDSFLSNSVAYVVCLFHRQSLRKKTEDIFRRKTKKNKFLFSTNCRRNWIVPARLFVLLWKENDVRSRENKNVCCFFYIGLIIRNVAGDDDDNRSLIIDSFSIWFCCNSSRSSKSKSVRFGSDEVNIRLNRLLVFLFFFFYYLWEKEKKRERSKR